MSKRNETLVPPPAGTQWRIENYSYTWLLLLPEGEWYQASIPNFFYGPGRKVSTNSIVDAPLHSPYLARKVSKKLARQARKILAEKKYQAVIAADKAQAWKRLKEGVANG
jgi:hypothetical protein